MRRSWAAFQAQGRRERGLRETIPCPRAAAFECRGQVVVEVLLVLPIFLWLVFMIMEIGHLAFRTILLHHAAYEVARYGSLTSSQAPSQSCQAPNPNVTGMQAVAKKILPTATMDAVARPTGSDPQANCPTYDLVVTITQRVPMIFPMTGIWLADKGARARTMRASVPMPVEIPLFR